MTHFCLAENLPTQEFATANKSLIVNPYHRDLHNQWYDAAADFYGENKSRFDYLNQAIKQHPKDSLLYQDYITQQSWLGQHQIAVENYQSSSFSQPQVFMLRAIAQSARWIELYDLAKSLYQKLIQKDSNDADAHLGVMLVDLQTNRPQLAIDYYQSLNDRLKKNQPIQLALARAYQRLDHHPKAVLILQNLLSQNPQDDNVYELTADAYQAAGMPQKAFQMLEQRSKAIRLDYQLEIWSTLHTYIVRDVLNHDLHSEQINKTLSAIEFNRKYHDFLKKELNDQNSKLIRSALADRLVLLNGINEHQVVIDEYKKIKELDIPLYGLNVVAGSWLALEEPDEALKVIQPYLESTNNFDTLIISYFGYLESEDYDKAYQQIERIDEITPTWFHSNDKKRYLENFRKAGIELMKLMHTAYKNQSHKALPKLVKLLKKAPMNQEYLFNLSKLNRWVREPLKSSESLQAIKNVESSQQGLLVESFHLFMAFRDYEYTELYLNKLKNTYPLNDDIPNLNKSWDAHDSNLFRATYRKQQAEGSRFSNVENQKNIYFHTQPIKYDWRILLKASDKQAEIQSNQVIRMKQQGLGIAYEKEKWSAQIYNIRTSSHEGNDWSIDGNYVINDHWNVGLGFQTFSEQTPLRAFSDDTTVKEISFNLNHQHQNRFYHSLRITGMNFSDENNRQQINFHASQQLFRDEHNQWTLHENLFWQNNSKPNQQSYFNPENYKSFTLGINFQGMLHRRYDRYWQHEVNFVTGLGIQDDFNENEIGSIEYRHQYHFNKKSNVYAGIGFGLNHYDNDKETGPFIAAGAEWRF